MKIRTGISGNTLRQGGKTRLAIQTWIGVYPVLTVIALILEPILSDMEIPLRTLVMSVLMVPIMVFWIMPLIDRVARKA